MDFQPTHVERQRGYQQVQTLGEVIIMTQPHDGIVGIRYRDAQGREYVRTLDEFVDTYKQIE